MKTKEEIEAIQPDMSQATLYPSMTYEQGVEDMRRFVLGEMDEEESTEFTESLQTNP